MNIKIKFAALLLSLCSMVSVAQTAISTYTPGISAEGAVYCLPKTAINISITTTKTIYVPGELCQYADRYLRINGISDKEEVAYEITSVAISTAGLPDTKKLYHILFSANSVAPLVDMSETGILRAINTTAISSVQEKRDANVVTESKKEIGSRPYMTEEMLMAGSKAKLAELVAKDIYNIRESRNLIIRGQSENIPKDGEGLKVMLEGLQEQETALMQLFVGATSTESFTQTYQVVPESGAEKVLLGRFSRKLGLLHGDDLSGSPIYVDIIDMHSVPTPVEVAEEETKKKKQPKKDVAKQDGLVYNVPGRAEVKVYTNTKTLAEESLVLAQFGNTETLSSAFFSKKNNIRVLLDPVTGALLKVEE